MQSYLKNSNNLEFLCKWEEMHNPVFNPHRAVGIKSGANASPYFPKEHSVKWKSGQKQKR
jgi:hypothetical protein